MPEVIITENNLENSSITVITKKNIEDIWQEQIKNIRDEIQSQISDDTMRRVILREVTNVDSHFKNDLPTLKSLLSQVNCDKTKNDAAYAITIDRIIHFFIVCKLVDAFTVAPNNSSNKFSVNQKNHWIFNAAKMNQMSLDTHIGAIADFISSRDSCEISNGSAFICQLLSNGSLNCDQCSNGELNIQPKLSKILPNFFNSKRGVAINDEARKNDFFELEKRHRIQFKCGNCVTNLFDLTNAQKVLK